MNKIFEHRGANINSRYYEFEGDLYRVSADGDILLRPRFKFHFGEIKTGRELRACLRAGPFAWPGGYPLYFVTTDGGALAFQTVRDNLREVISDIRGGGSGSGWRVCACVVNWEDNSLYDDHTGKRIKSAYGEG